VDWNEGWIVFVDDDGDRTVDAGEPIERSTAGISDLSVSTAEFPQFLLYRPNGRVMVNNVADNSGEFVLCDTRGAPHARVVLIDESGRPRVSTETLAGAAPVCAS
jgi:type IV fimbrial biogenesis protein FimT